MTAPRVHRWNEGHIAQREQEPRTRVIGVARFERFLRLAGLQVDERTWIATRNSSITKSLQESMYAFRDATRTLTSTPFSRRMLWEPPLDLAIGTDTEERLPAIAGGLSVAMARTLKLLDRDLKNREASTGNSCSEF